MTKTDQYLKRQGFSITSTGGNCTAWTKMICGEQFYVAADVGHHIKSSYYRMGLVGVAGDETEGISLRSFNHLKRWIRAKKRSCKAKRRDR